MTTSQVLHAIAELVHAMRPQWDRAGIYSACHGAAATRPLDQVAHSAIDAAMDKTARTPAVIATRDRTWQPTLDGTAPPATTTTVLGHVHEPRASDEVTSRGAANARHALAMTRDRVDDGAKRRQVPDPDEASATTDPPPRNEP